MLPPMSVPMPSAEPSIASSAPSPVKLLALQTETIQWGSIPPEDPPGVWSTFHGLSDLPQSGLLHSKASSVCGTLVLTNGTAPAALRSLTIYARSLSGDQLLRTWQGYQSVARGRSIDPGRVPDSAVHASDLNYTSFSLVVILSREARLHISFKLRGTP